MTSSKRKLSKPRDDGRKKTKKIQQKNPFLDLESVRAEGSNSNEDLLAHTVAFLELQKKKKTNPKQQPEKSLLESLEYLLDFLERNLSLKENDDVESKSDEKIEGPVDCTAAMLLPWVTGELLDSTSTTSDDSSNVFLWRTLAASLKVLTAENNNRLKQTNVIHQALTGKALLKLIPQASHVGMTSNNNTASEHATICYEILLGKSHFIPSLDVAWQSLVSGIVQDIAESQIHSQACRVILATFQVLEDILKKSNPKTAFQVLSTEESLLKWSRINFFLEDHLPDDERSSACQELMRKILWASFFHPDHHLEGFRSLAQLRGIPSLERENTNDKPKDPGIMEVDDSEQQDDGSKKSVNRFHCYQENLLNSLETLLLAPSSVSATKSKINLTQSLVLMARLLPLLLQGYLERLTEFEAKNQKTTYSKKKGSKFDLAQMQLFFFGYAAALLWQRRSLSCSTDDQNVTTQHSLKSIDKCLKLFFQHDAFVPSDDEKQMTRFGFLESLTVGMLETSWPDSEGSQYTTSILENLMRLDHRLVHGRLESVLDFITIPSLDQLSNDGATEATTSMFLVTLFETYHLLRQFHHVFDSILATASTLQANDKMQQLCTLHSMLSHHRAKRAFADAVFASPALETRKMFESLDKRITDAATSKWHRDKGRKTLETAVQCIGGGLLSNVKVDKSTAAEVAHSCETIMNNSVQTLCRQSDGRRAIAERTKFGVKLCGWIIALQMRSSFWLGYHYIQKSEIESAMPRSVKHLLLSVNQAAESNEGASSLSAKDLKPLLDDLVVLASFRLRKLDYLIHEQSLGEIEELSPRQQYQEEAKRLAGLMVHWANDNAVEGSMWLHIAHMITSWVPYADKDHLKSFWMWLFKSLADVKTKVQTQTRSLPSGRDRAVAQALVNDASFFEIHQLSDQMAPCALDSITLLIRDALEATSNSTADELCLLNHPGWVASSPDEFARLFGRESRISVNSKAATILRGALRVAKILSGFPVYHSSAFSLKCADSAVRIQLLCSRLDSEDTDVKRLVIDLVSTLRLVAAQHFTLAGKDALNLLPDKKSKIKDLLAKVLDATAGAIRRAFDLGEGQFKKIFFASEELAKAIYGCYFQQGSSKRSLCDALVDFSKSAFCTKKKLDEAETVALCCQGRALLTSLCASKTALYAWALGDLLSTHFNWMAALPESTKSSEFVYEHLRLFAGISFQMASKGFEDGIPAQMVEQMTALLKDLAPPKLSDARSKPAVEATSYMLLGYALTNPPVDQRLSLIDKLLRTECESSTLNASICYLVRGIESESLRETLEKVNQRILEGWILGLRLFQLFIQGLKTERQLEIVSSFSEGILRKSLDVLDMSSDPENPAKNVVVASGLIVQLMQDKRLMTVKERHVALILAQTSKVLQHANTAEEMYSSCFTLVAALVQRFPKQMCTCVPSLIAVLHTFQGQVLYSELDDIAIRQRSQKFTRLCELLLPHKDVYKKHVLCLLLEFVHCLEHGLSFFRKECLLPSVFYLLDMLSKYEMQQLNTLMATTAKALFRSVHQSYNKHQYKGQ